MSAEAVLYCASLLVLVDCMVREINQFGGTGAASLQSIPASALVGVTKALVYTILPVGWCI